MISLFYNIFILYLQYQGCYDIDKKENIHFCFLFSDSFSVYFSSWKYNSFDQQYDFGVNLKLMHKKIKEKILNQHKSHLSLSLCKIECTFILCHITWNWIFAFDQIISILFFLYVIMKYELYHFYSVFNYSLCFEIRILK